MAPSPPGKHPRSEESAPAPPSPPKRRRTALYNPVPPNYRRSDLPGQTAGPNAPSTPGSRPVAGGRSRLALQQRCFAPKPLLSPFAAHILGRNREAGGSGLRQSAPLPSPGKPSASRQSSAAADSAAMPPPPLPKPRNIFSSAVSAPAKIKASPAPTGGAHDSHRPHSSDANRSSFFAFLNEPPAGSASSQNSPIASHVPSSVSSAEGTARADGILSTIQSTIAKAKGYLAVNRADRLEEKKEQKREAARKKYEEEERAKRDEMFRQLRESHEMYQRAEKAKRESLIQQGDDSMEAGVLRSSREGRANHEQALEAHGSSEPNGGPSFVTESTVLDSLNYADQVGSDDGADATQATFLAPRPQSPRLRDSDIKREAEARASKTPVISLVSDDDSEPENSGPLSFFHSQKNDPEPRNLRLPPFSRSQRGDPEPGNLRPPPFTHSRKETQAIDVDEENAFGDAEDDYTEDDESEGLSERAHSEETGPREDSEGTRSPASGLEAPMAASQGEAEEIIDCFPGSTVWSDNDDGNGDDGRINGVLIEYDTLLAEDFEEYDEEEKTEKDDSDVERAFAWDTGKAATGQDFDQSLGSTVLLPSQPTSFMDATAATPGSSASSSQGTPVPNMHVTSPLQPGEQGGTGLLALGSITEGTGSHESPVSIASSPRDSPTADGRYGMESDPQHEEVAASPDCGYMGLVIQGKHVYNQHQCHIGTVDEYCYVYADTDDSAVGRIDDHHSFHPIVHGDARGRGFSYEELNRRPTERPEVEYEFDKVEAGSAARAGNGNGDTDEDEEVGDAPEDEEVDLMEQDGDNDEVMSDEGEEQTGQDLDGDHDGMNMDTGDTEASPASIGNVPFFHFSYNTSQSQPPTQTEPQFFGNPEIPIDPDLAMPEAPTFGEEISPVVKNAEPCITPEVIADSPRQQVEEASLVVEDAGLSITTEVAADSPQQVEEVYPVVEDAELSITTEVIPDSPRQQVEEASLVVEDAGLSITTEDVADSPQQVEEVYPVVEDAESSITTEVAADSPQQVEEVSPVVEDAGLSITTEDVADSPQQVEEVYPVVEDAELSITTEVAADSPQQVEEVSPVIEDAELSITTEDVADSPQQVEEVSPVVDDAELSTTPEVTTNSLAQGEEELLGASSEVSIKVEEGDIKEHEERQEETPAPLLPDSIEDQSPMVGEVGSEGSAEIVEWDLQSPGEEGSEELSDSGSEVAEPGKAGEKTEHQIDRSESSIKLELEAGVQPVTEPTPGYLFEHSESPVKLKVEDESEMEGVSEYQTDHSESSMNLELEAGCQPATEQTPGYLFEHSESPIKLEAGIQPAAEAAPVSQYEHSESPIEFELEPGVQADIEDTNNSDPEVPDRLSEDPAQQTELGNRCDGPSNVTDEDKELRRVSGIEVVVDQPRQITPISASPTTFSPQVETPSRKRKFRPDSPPSEASPPAVKVEPAHDDGNQMDIDDEKIAPTTKKKRGKPKAKPKKKQADKPYVPPKEEAEPEDDQDLEPKAKRRRKSKSRVTTEDVAAVVGGHEAYSGDEKLQQATKLEEAGGGEIAEPSPPVITPPKKAAPRRGRSAEPRALQSREGSEAPEYRTLRNRTVMTNRGRSASVEVSAAETDPGKIELRRSTRARSQASAPESPKKSPIRKTMRTKGSAGPAAGVRKMRGKTPLSSIQEVAGEESPKKAKVPRKK